MAKIKLKEKTIFDLGDPFWFSGFCLTDNENFSEFYLKKIPRLNFEYKSFDFSEKDMIYKIEKEVKKEKIKDKVSKHHFNYFEKKYKDIKLYLVSFLQTNGFVGIVKEDRLVGILKLKEK
jgi:hypothetical protein